MTTLHIGGAPLAKTADQLAAERRDRRAARRQLVGHILDAVDIVAFVALSLLLIVLLYGTGPFEGAHLLLLG